MRTFLILFLFLAVAHSTARATDSRATRSQSAQWCHDMIGPTDLGEVNKLLAAELFYVGSGNYTGSSIVTDFTKFEDRIVFARPYAVTDATRPNPNLFCCTITQN